MLGMLENRSTYPSIKLHRPQKMAGLIPRSRLLSQLGQVLHKPVALISAPAGFGKTTLISQWLDECELPTAWLQLDEFDHEIPAFLTGFIAALRQLFPGCMQKTSDLVMASGTITMQIWKTTLIDDLELLGENPFVLVLEDYHLVSNPSIDLLLVELLRSEINPMHLIISARRTPSISFSRLRIQRQIVEISTADLRFNRSEISLFFDQTTDFSLDKDVVQQIQQKTEGWAAALALAAISLRKNAQIDEMIAKLTGSDTQVSNYLLDQVLNSQPAEIQEFLLKTATFDQFCTPMLYEAFEFEQSEAEIQELIERIEAAQLFLVSLDKPGAYYRYHHLFRQMLLSRQHFHLTNQQIDQLHHRAAAWLMRNGRMDDAFNHLVSVGNWPGAAQLVESQLSMLLNAEDYQGIKRRLGFFSESFIASRPGLLLMQLWIAHFGLRIQVILALIAKIQVLIDDALRARKTGSNAPVGFEVIPLEVVQAHIWTQEALVYFLTNQVDLAVPLARQAAKMLPENWQFVRGNAMVYYGLSYLMQGQYSQAVEELKEGYENLQDTTTAYGARLLFTRSVVYLLNGDLELCRQTAEQLLHDASTHNLLLNQGWGCYLLGRVYQEWNQLELAADYYLQGVELRFSSNIMAALECIAGYAYIFQILDRGEQAQQFLNSVEQLHGEQFTVTPPLLMALSAWMDLENGNPEKAQRWAEAFNAPVANQAIVWYHLPHLYQVKILMDNNKPGSYQAINQLLDEIQALAERTHNTFTLVRVLALRAAWLARCGKTIKAQQALEHALRLGRPGWFIHAFVKQGPELQELLHATLRRQVDIPDIEEYIEAILAAFVVTGEARIAAKDRSSIKTLLTEREKEVLERLAERLSINEIASQLSISPSTVQQHTHHIYRKLNVTNKREAVVAAIDLGILPTRK